MTVPDSCPSGFTAFAVQLGRSKGLHTLILFGSRARGDADERSDIDLLGIGEALATGAISLSFEGIPVDLTLVDEKDLEGDIFPWLKVEDGLVIFEQGRLGTSLLSRVKAMMLKGPQPLTPGERDARLAWAGRMAERASRDDDEGRYRFHWLISELPQLAFELSGRYWPGIKRALPALEKDAPAFHTAYLRLLSEGDGACLAACIDELRTTGN